VSHRSDPFDQKRLPQADFAPYRQYRAMPLRHGYLLTRTLPQLYKSWGEAKKLLTSRRESRASLISNE
jgi:hypothetical protein